MTVRFGLTSAPGIDGSHRHDGGVCRGMVSADAICISSSTPASSSSSPMVVTLSDDGQAKCLYRT